MSPLDGPDNVRDSGQLRGMARELLREIHAVESELKGVHQQARMLPALTARNLTGERDRMISELRHGRAPKAHWKRIPTTSVAHELRIVDRLRRRVGQLPIGDLYLERLDELELELCMLESLGRERAVRPLAARRFGTGSHPTTSPLGDTLSECARRILDELDPEPEPKTIPSKAFRASRCLAGMIETLARSADLGVEVVVDSRLVAGAATGERTIYIADRMFGFNEARRLAVHEVLGHLLASANGRNQVVRILEWGTASAFADQEGVALCLEASAGWLDIDRLRTLAGRVLAGDMLHGGASFGDTAVHLAKTEQFAPEDAVVLAERAYRGGGVARDVSYLDGYLRVRDAVARGQTTLDELRAGRLSVAALPHVAALRNIGLFCEPAQRPNLSRSFCSTNSGTTPVRLPPSDAASLMRFELT